MLTFIVPAAGEQLPLVRHRVSSWLASHRVSGELRRDVVTVVDEAVSNSIQHGYADADGLVAVTVQAGPAEVLALVADHGSWSGAAAGGLGLAVMRGLAQEVELLHEDGRTTLSARFERRRAGDRKAWAPPAQRATTDRASASR
ncbi:ATP-binding protein [Actinokineospora bangkokensis]|uniref:Histidine kinase/HSP90-like ATPase domain-containing protein n=1 Tax=Actinokineospora bangkokensis TaxID=1193682 RepID=A0A1Q9LKV9_9PSEU|nr:ATP-binding protein [Actinokineospora bangkokensis]OLR92635.1 hypothetical protein BJP25_21585 [Actinokineospora bangkokensis]